MTEYHEPVEELSAEFRDRHRVLRTIIEEFEAIDWYDQRASVSHDPEVQALMRHNRDEEIEHAAMALEWFRRNEPKADEHFREFLFTTGSITEHESSSNIEETPASNTAGESENDGNGLMTDRH
jgi:uncharacterized protein